MFTITPIASSEGRVPCPIGTCQGLNSPQSPRMVTIINSGMWQITGSDSMLMQLPTPLDCSGQTPRSPPSHAPASIATPSSSVVSVTTRVFGIGLEGTDQTAVAGVRHHRDLANAGVLQHAIDLRPAMSAGPAPPRSVILLLPPSGPISSAIPGLIGANNRSPPRLEEFECRHGLYREIERLEGRDKIRGAVVP